MRCDGKMKIYAWNAEVPPKHISFRAPIDSLFLPLSSKNLTAQPKQGSFSLRSCLSITSRFRKPDPKGFYQNLGQSGTFAWRRDWFIRTSAKTLRVFPVIFGCLLSLSTLKLKEVFR
jgi:hypothetical protein